MPKKKGAAKGPVKAAVAAGPTPEELAAAAAKVAALPESQKAAAEAIAGLAAEDAEARGAAAAKLAEVAKGDKLGACFVFATVGYSGDKELDTLALIKEGLDNSKDANMRAGALQAIESLANAFGTAISTYLIPMLPFFVELYADKQGFVREAAETAGKAWLDCLPGTTTRYAMELLYTAATTGGPTNKWQVQVAGLNLIQALCEKSPENAAQGLAETVNCTSDLMNASKKQVAEAATAAMGAACLATGNRDIEPFIPKLISSVTNLEDVQECIHGLAATVFVQEVRGPALAVTVPLLFRGLREKQQALKRKCATIINNMCQLVADPSEVLPFIDRLAPGLEKAASEMTDENAQRVVRQTREFLLQNEKAAEEFIPMEPPAIGMVFRKELREDMSVYDSEKLDNVVDFLAYSAWSLIDKKCFDDEAWEAACGECMDIFINSYGGGAGFKKTVLDATKTACFAATRGKVDVEDHDEEGEDLCNCEFTLGYGSKILLSNTRIHLKRGKRYGLVGPNDCGKSTLLRAIANGQLEGFPPRDELKSIYVEHDVQGITDPLSIIDFVMMDPNVIEAGNTKEDAIEVLADIGFNSKKAQGGQVVTNDISTLSGGWKMKLALARAILSKADILMCDEPTNHLDVDNVAWVTDYLKTAKKADGQDISTICVSHDSKFMDSVCTHIIHFEGRKLKTYVGNLKAFVQKVPEAASYYSFKSAKTKFIFPKPAALEGIKTKAKPILSMTNVGFTYPGTTRAILHDVSVSCTLGSRIAVIGPNGAGKSTAIKVLTGEMPPTHGTTWRHPNMRFAYVAQHAFHHLEAHLEKTPVEYILWRYSGGYDKELAAQGSLVYTPEEEAKMAKKISILTLDGEKKYVLERIVSRRKTKKTYEYEVKWQGQPMESNTWMTLEKLTELGFKKMLSAVDIRENSKMGLTARALTTKFVTEQLHELGLEEEYAAHVRINQLSGGQKVKVVLASAMWGQPHVLILDEPTNYLDRDSLGALAQAISEFEGGVVIISHNRDFVEEVCRTLWFMVEGKLRVEGEQEVDEKIEEDLGPSTYTDAAGNTHEVKREKALTKGEIKKLTKRIKEKIKKDERLDTDEENFAIEFNL